MFNLGSESSCDICLEPFATGPKAASAIFCGHVFCFNCIQALRAAPSTSNHPDPNYKPCPLCRTTFDTRQCIRLHIDLDAHPSATDREALSLLDKMVTIANDTSSEVQLRESLATVMTFAQQHQQSTHFCALYACGRILTYAIDVRARERRLVIVNAEVEAQITRLREERDNVERRAREDREMSLSIEKSLRDHAQSAQEGYESMIQHYNKVVDDMRNICQSLQYRDDSRSRPLSQTSSRDIASHINQRLASYHDSHVRRDEHVMTDPENLLVSPLSTLSALPSQPLVIPDEAPVAKAPRKAKRRHRSKCHNQDHPAGCTCAIDYTDPSAPTHRSNATTYDRPVEPYVHNIANEYDRDRERQPSPCASRSKAIRDHSPYSRDQPVPHDRSPRGHEQPTARDRSPYSRDQPTVRDHGRDQTTPLYNDEDITHSASSSYSGSTRRSHRQGSNSNVHRDLSPYGRDQPLDRSPYDREQTASSYNNDEEITSLRSTGSTSRPQRQGSMSLRDRSPTPIPPSPPTLTQSAKIAALHDLLSDNSPADSSSQFRTPLPSSHSSAASLLHESPNAVNDHLTPLVGHYTLPKPAPELIARRREAQQQELLREVQGDNLSPAARDEDHSLTAPTPTSASYNPAYVLPYNGPISSASGAAKAKERERAEKAEREKRKAEREERRKAKRQEAGYPQAENYMGYGPPSTATSSCPSKSKWPSDSFDVVDRSQPPPPPPPQPYTSTSQRASGSGSHSKAASRYAEKYGQDNYYSNTSNSIAV